MRAHEKKYLSQKGARIYNAKDEPPSYRLVELEKTVRNVLEILKERGLLEAVSSDELKTLVESPLKIYIGFDPTADSLHLGHLVGIIVLSWFQRCGHTAVALVGGATGMIGDPSGKSVERPLLDAKSLQENLCGIRKNLESILDFSSPSNPPYVVNNYDWLKDYTFIEFMREVGRHFRLGPMLAKESVKVRLESEEGMSLMEFMYQTLQAFDFLHLFSSEGVTLQGGGSDQWGNITAGIELVRKLCHKPVHGITFPLLTRSDGKKFGKTEEGAIWLSAEKLSCYHFYQYLFRVPDADVIGMLKKLTFLDLDEIFRVEQAMQGPSYQPNTAQRLLAQEVTRLVHGEEGLKLAERMTEGMRPGSQTNLEQSSLEALAQEMPTTPLAKGEALGKKIVDLLVEVSLVASKGDARRLIRNGGAYLNNQKVEDENAILQTEHLVGGHLVLLSAGKKNKALLTLHE